VLTLVLLPLALAIVMLGLGLNLTTADFARVVTYPRAVVIALACQVLLLPVLCFGLVVAFDLPPLLAVGMMLLAASPGGTTANLYSHLFRGDVALNITLTAINSVIAVFTLPLIVNVSLGHFVGGSGELGLQYDKVVQVFAIVLVPVAFGMLVRRRFAAFADRMYRPVKMLSVVVLVVVIVGAIIQERETLLRHGGAVVLVSLLFSALSLTIGYWLPRLADVGRPQAVASSMEIGIHNSTLAITVALNPALLDSAEMAVPAAVYGILMFFTAAAAGWLITWRSPAPGAAEAKPQTTRT
jgi:bile acid:Na+ symporter, BASS family